MRLDYDPATPDYQLSLEEAVETLRHLLESLDEWRQPAKAWEEFATLLDALESALASRDAVAVESATAELEAVSQERVTKIGEPSDTGPPPPVRDQIVVLQGSVGEALDAVLAPPADDEGKGASGHRQAR